MKTKIKTLLGAVLSLLATFAFTPSASAQTKGVSLPPNAQEIEPGVYYLGRVKDHRGRNVDGIAFVHSRKLAAKPGGGGGGGGQTQDPCYAFLYYGVHWRNIEDFVISPTIANAPDGALFLDQITLALDNWEAAAGKQIFGSGTVGDVDLASIGNSINGVNEVTFAPIADPTVLAFTVVWSVFNVPSPKREIIEWDMVFRDDAPFFGAEPEPGEYVFAYDFWGTFAHESGHAAGLAHPSDTCTEETMYRYTSIGQTKKRTLNAGDIAGIAALYK